MSRYAYEDIKIDTDVVSNIVDGIYGMKIEVPLFVDSAPSYFKEKALELVNDFIENHNNVFLDSIDSVDGTLEAYINKKVNPDEKYGMTIYIWNNENGDTKDYHIRLKISTESEEFLTFRDYVMGELKSMMFA